MRSNLKRCKSSFLIQKGSPLSQGKSSEFLGAEFVNKKKLMFENRNSNKREREWNDYGLVVYGLHR